MAVEKVVNVYIKARRMKAQMRVGAIQATLCMDGHPFSSSVVDSGSALVEAKTHTNSKDINIYIYIYFVKIQFN